MYIIQDWAGWDLCLVTAQIGLHVLFNMAPGHVNMRKATFDERDGILSVFSGDAEDICLEHVRSSMQPAGG